MSQSTTQAPTRLLNVREVYEGSDGELTKELYRQLEAIGPVGVVCVNLLRAQKASARAKVYRGGSGGRSYRDMSYDKKQWSIDNLAKMLSEHADKLGILWGWAEDPQQSYHRWVLYFECPQLPADANQVSFHTDKRGVGPIYPKPFDGMVGASAPRIVQYVQAVYDAAYAGGGAS